LFARFGSSFVSQASRSKKSNAASDIEQGYGQSKSSKISMPGKISKVQPSWTYDEMDSENDIPVDDRHEMGVMAIKSHGISYKGV
jgi:hypothetical protein